MVVLLTTYYSGDLTKKSKAGGPCNTNGESKRGWEREIAVHIGIWWGDLMERGPLGKLRHRWEYNIKVDLRDIRLIDLQLGGGRSLGYGRETWSLTRREEWKLRVFENRVLRRIFGTRMEEVTGEWRRLRNEELNDLYSSPNIVRVIKSRRMRWAGHVARTGEERGVYRVLVGKP